jgi:hypothetical protein
MIRMDKHGLNIRQTSGSLLTPTDNETQQLLQEPHSVPREKEASRKDTKKAMHEHICPKDVLLYFHINEIITMF